MLALDLLPLPAGFSQPFLAAAARRFAAAGEAAVDLLARLLAFDPARRCSPEEALAHEYFADVALSEGGAPA